VEGKIKCGSSLAFLFQLTKWRGNVRTARDQGPIAQHGPSHWSKGLVLLPGKMQILRPGY